MWEISRPSLACSPYKPRDIDELIAAGITSRFFYFGEFGGRRHRNDPHMAQW